MQPDVVLVERKPARLKDVVPLSGRTLKLTWDDGVAELRDVFPILANHRSLVRLRQDDHLFSTVRVKTGGFALEWEDGTEVTAQAIRSLPRTSMDNREFRNLMDDLHLSVEAISVTLGLSRRLIADYRRDKPIPKHVVLALRYLAERRERAVF
ncbi:DUF2442 domain-containing protein [Youhaiella tibetensis]|uniref:DUF2442 domain-containing protein n=1 Tax=Paradevosia tibetensis TaxID=1447062 RepID=UPI001478309F|nr:DUF2442 domain-containing protein [Youhaiella tibetensis]